MQRFEDIEITALEDDLRPDRHVLPDALVRLVRAMRANPTYDHRAVRLGDLGLISDFSGWVIEQAAAYACGDPDAERKLWQAYRFWKDEVDKKYG